MKTYDAVVLYRTPGHKHRRRPLGGIVANGTREARRKARDMFEGERARMVSQKNYVVATIVGITLIETSAAVPAPTPAPEGLVEKADLLEQIRGLIDAPAKDPRIGTVVHKTSGDYEFDGVIVGVVTKLSGAERFVVEDARGLLLIMNAKQVGL